MRIHLRAALLATLCVACADVQLVDADRDGLFEYEDCDDRDPDVREGSVQYTDADRDGYGTGEVQVLCHRQAGFSSADGDCDDTLVEVHPRAAESCNGLDDDCDGLVDDPLVYLDWYADTDGDGYGDEEGWLSACASPGEGWVRNPNDCDDGDASVHPDAPESCNGLDDDCDGTADEVLAIPWYPDDDGDGFGRSGEGVVGCGEAARAARDGDCDDGDPAINPDAVDVCDGVDTDCDGVLDTTWTFWSDSDGDGYGDPETERSEVCDPTSIEVRNGEDCDDLDAAVHPAATEDCFDGEDNDCDGRVDFTAWYMDGDGDGLGDVTTSSLSCVPLAGWVTDPWDCDDTDASEPTVADPAHGSDRAAGSLDDPHALLQDAIDAAGRCVIALPGTYAEALEVSVGGLDIMGIEGSDRTVIDPGLTPCTSADAASCRPAVAFAAHGGTASTLRGFRVSGGTGNAVSAATTRECGGTCTTTTWSYCGGGIHVEGAPVVLSDLVVTGNELPAAATVVVSATEDEVYESRGAGICLEAGATADVTHVVVADNSADAAGAIHVAASTLSMSNSVASCNRGGWGLQAEGGAGVVLDHVSLAANGDGEILLDDTSSAGVENSVIEADGTGAALTGEGAGTLRYSDVTNARGPTVGGGFVETDGVSAQGGNFVAVSCDGDASNDDLALVAGSAALDAGDPGTAADTDGSAPDMGAYGGPGGDW